MKYDRSIHPGKEQIFEEPEATVYFLHTNIHRHRSHAQLRVNPALIDRIL